MLMNFMDWVMGRGNQNTTVKIEGTVVLMKKNVLDFNDFGASLLDRIYEFLGRGVGFQLVSAEYGDPEEENRGRLSKTANLEGWITTITPAVAAKSSSFKVTFEWDESLGTPGAIVVKNNHRNQFFLKTITLKDVPGKGRLHFVCNSWVFPARYYKYDRVFFVNETILPSETPEPLRKYREEELVHLRGDGAGELQEWDRVYDYAVYNDLGDPDKGPEYARPVLGGSARLPYPRRGRTGRKPTKRDPNSETRLPLLSLDIYVPKDERFGHVKMSDFLAYALKSVVQFILPESKALIDSTLNEFDTFQDVLNLYEGGIRLPHLPAVVKGSIPLEMIKELVRTDGERFLKFPLPQVIQNDKFAWRTDEEFAREMLAGLNPVSICRLEEFPPVSELDPDIYGNQDSTIMAEEIENNMQGLSVSEALAKNRLFILNHHDQLMPFINRINSTTSTKMYATRTILFLKDDGCLAPVAIELSLPHPDGEELGAVTQVYTPAKEGVEASLWQLAKAYVAVNDSGCHQLISHWLNTHAAMEPFVIATNRQLSVMHPIYKLLVPHYRDTMNINALARQILINAGGLLELTVFPRKYSLEMSSMIYKNWVFTEQGLPADLLKRGVAIPDSSKPHNLRLLIEDYPYAVDGLEIWSAIEKWVEDYCSIYYTSDAEVQADTELQAWWKELREVGHGDKKDEPWWPKMQTVSELTQTCTIIIWIASALHAAVNFGQYPYAGFLPNRPTISRRFMPEPGTKDYAELEADPDNFFLRTITSQLQTLIGISLIEILSRHTSDEVYLGQRDTPEWTADEAALKAFEDFGDRLIHIENKIIEMNNMGKWKNRTGPVKMPYTLLYPNTTDFTGVGGLTGRGIPNSISI